MTRILVADDDRNLVDLVRAMLDEAGFEALVAHSGLAAADLIEREDFDLAVLDVLMPGMSGDALADLLHSLKPHVPVLLMTGDSGDQFVRSASSRASASRSRSRSSSRPCGAFLDDPGPGQASRLTRRCASVASRPRRPRPALARLAARLFGCRFCPLGLALGVPGFALQLPGARPELLLSLLLFLAFAALVRGRAVPASGACVAPPLPARPPARRSRPDRARWSVARPRAAAVPGHRPPPRATLQPPARASPVSRAGRRPAEPASARSVRPRYRRVPAQSPREARRRRPLRRAAVLGGPKSLPGVEQLHDRRASARASWLTVQAATVGLGSSWTAAAPRSLLPASGAGRDRSAPS